MIDWSKFPLAKRGKGFHQRETRERRAAKNAVIAATRELVFRLDPRCVVCFAPPRHDDEMNEVVPRSKTRGLPPEERFNRRICARFCGRCHQAATEHRIELAFLDPGKGVDGGLVIQRRGEMTAVVYWRQGTYNRTLERWTPVHGHGFRGRAWRGIWTEEGEMSETTTKPGQTVKKPMTPTKKPATGNRPRP